MGATKRILCVLNKPGWGARSSWNSCQPFNEMTTLPITRVLFHLATRCCVFAGSGKGRSIFDEKLSSTKPVVLEPDGQASAFQSRLRK